MRRMGLGGGEGRGEMWYVRTDRRVIYWILLGIHDVKRTLGNTKNRWEDNIKIIKMDLQEVVWTGMD